MRKDHLALSISSVVVRYGQSGIIDYADITESFDHPMWTPRPSQVQHERGLIHVQHFKWSVL